MSWNRIDSSELYGIEKWGDPYFSVNEDGHIEVKLPTTGHSIDLHTLTEDLMERGIRPPILIRFPDIVKERMQLLAKCFNQTIQEYEYQGSYTGVYPIKVNQQRHLIEEIVDFGRFNRLGLECGSKPELLVALAYMDTPGAYIICNGFKDSEYIETALLSQKLGRNTIIVVDRIVELDLIIEASKKLDIVPKIGFRAKLIAQGSGKWIESSGAKSKFGLTPSEMMQGIRKLKDLDLLDSLELLHFHIGSQISSIQSIKLSIKEGARFYTELHALGASPSLIDVGGGLGVDYDGSGKGDSSTNYSEQEYANDVISIIQSICDEKKVPHPNIISESGRALIAHSSVLVANVLGFNDVSKKSIYHDFSEKDSRLVLDLFELWQNISKDNINEFYNDLMGMKRDIRQLFSYGVLGLDQRAKADDLYWACVSKICELAEQNMDEAEDIYWELEKELCDTYFCNFSVFQSLPDSWAVGQIFPVVPIHRLNEKPTRRATLADLTCDSDGKINKFIDPEEETTQNYLEVHELKNDSPYYLGVFLAGAYQETLGDLHNLFGDTDAVHIMINENGYSVEHFVEGDSVNEVLNYVQYSKNEMLEKVRQSAESSIQRGSITRAEARRLMKVYEQGLDGYTYLEPAE